MFINKLKHLYPNAKIGPDSTDDVVLYLNGNEYAFEKWDENKLGPVPDIATINAVSDAVAEADEQVRKLSEAFELSKKDKTLIKWIANLNGLTANQARAQLKAIWDSLPD